MANLRKFGQYVLFEAFDAKGILIFSTDSLKIDFDIRDIEGWKRAKIELTNLDDKVINGLSNSDEVYVTIKTRLHDHPTLSILADKMYVSNAKTVRKLPELVTTLYCYDRLKKDVLEEVVDIAVPRPSLRANVDAVLQRGGYSGEIHYVNFPDTKLNFIPPRKSARLQGKVSDVLRMLGKENGFKVFTSSSSITILYIAHEKDYTSTDFVATSTPTIKLNTSNMRSTPEISPGKLSFGSNLDPRIKPGSVLDISDLLTIDTNVTQSTLEVAENILKSQVAGFSRYQSLQVQHRGSNWSNDWLTQVIGLCPVRGDQMQATADQWWKSY